MKTRARANRRAPLQINPQNPHRDNQESHRYSASAPESHLESRTGSPPKSPGPLARPPYHLGSHRSSAGAGAGAGAAHHGAGCALTPTPWTIMCPPIPGLALLNISISYSWSDEELVRFLAERKAGDLLPQNVLVGMNFSLIDPRVSSGNIWYLNCSDDQQTYDNGENAIRNAENGYWKSVDALRIPTSTDIVGVKISLEFYEGQAPSGQRTGWVMHEYQVEQNDEANVPQDYKSLCTIFLQGDKKFNVEDQRISRNANAPNDRLESYLQYLAEIEEQNAAMNSQIVASNQQNFSPSKGQDEHKTHNAADAIAFHRALANEDYIETNDLLSSDPTASTSEYSSRRSMISEEYFDSDAFLREISNDSNTTDEEHKDCKFSICAPTNSDLVVISLPEQGLVHNHDNNATVSGTSLEKSVPDGERDQHSNECPQHNPSTSSCFPSSHVKRSRSNSSNSSQGSTKSPQRDRSIGKFGKIGKKYCCFGSF